MSFPHYHLVPKDTKANLLFRQKLLQECENDLLAQQQVRAMFDEDILFAINAFYWTFDPRNTETPAVPFITWDFQDECFQLQEECLINGKDLLYDKSRDMGASWILLSHFHHRWMSKAMQSFLMVSRNESYVDESGNPKTLFWKIDFINKNLPGWLVPPMERKLLHIGNLANGSTIDGESTTGEVARGDRRTAILLDEFASVPNSYDVMSATMAATKCRFFNSTPKGPSGAFYDLATSQNSDVARKSLHWSRHPVYSKGLYYGEDGKPRSPWYDEQCRRCANMAEIRQELDIDYTAGSFQFFEPSGIHKYIEKFCEHPRCTGELLFDNAIDNIEFSESSSGRLHIWCPLNAELQPPKDDDYVIGADVAMGTQNANGQGASNSVLSVSARKGSRKVAEFAVSLMHPHELGDYALALARFFTGESGPAKLIWENHGPGNLFGEQIWKNRGYRNIYFQPNTENHLVKKSTLRPGWSPNQQAKYDLLFRYRAALHGERFINPSEKALKETLAFICKNDRQIVHQSAAMSEDPTASGHNHGDRVIADALCWHYILEKPRHITEAEQPRVLPYGSFAWRRERYERLEQAMKDGDLPWSLCNAV